MQEDHGCWFALNDVTYVCYYTYDVINLRYFFPLCLDIPVPWEVSMLLPHSCTLYSLYVRETASSPFHLDLPLN